MSVLYKYSTRLGCVGNAPKRVLYGGDYAKSIVFSPDHISTYGFQEVH